jgi:sugar O-acyltransferase (sialic acid O-acetyltransferase NeuD family)
MTMDEAGRRIVVFGAGGHAKSVVSVLHEAGTWRVAAMLEEGAHAGAKTVLGHEVVGDASRLAALRRSGIDKGFVAIGDNRARGRIARVLEDAGFELVRVIHPSAVRLQDAAIGPGSFVHALSLIGAECRIGRNGIVQPFCCVGHEGRIGDCVQFCPSVTVGGAVTIGDYGFFGPGAVIWPRVTIGRNVSVTANSVVTEDVGDDVVVAGNPARPVKRKDPIA